MRKTALRTKKPHKSRFFDLKKKYTKFKRNLSPFQRKLLDILFFVYSFLLLGFIFQLVLRSGLQLYWLKLAVANSVSFLFNLAGIESATRETFIIIQNTGWKVEIIRDCTGWKSFFALFALILITPKKSLREKSLGILVAIPFVFVITVLRVFTSMLYGLELGIEKFQYFHDILWQFALIIVLLGYWYAWLKYFENKTKSLYSCKK